MGDLHLGRLAFEGAENDVSETVSGGEWYLLPRRLGGPNELRELPQWGTKRDPRFSTHLILYYYIGLGYFAKVD